MARNANHVTDHNELVALLDEQAARFGYTKVSGGPFSENDPAHIEQHNLMVTDLQGLAALAGQSFSTVLPPVANRGDAGHPKDHDAVRDALAEVAGWAAWNAATGGLEQSIGNYNGTGQRWMVHTFTGNGTFTVTRGAQPFRVALGAGGGGGGYSGHYGWTGGTGGRGQTILNDSATLNSGALAVLVGGGAGGEQKGGTSSIDGSFAADGGGGATGAGTGHHGANGSPSYPGMTSDITGASGTFPAGAGGAPGDPGGGYGKPGGAGQVVIAYRIS